VQIDAVINNIEQSQNLRTEPVRPMFSFRKRIFLVLTTGYCIHTRKWAWRPRVPEPIPVGFLLIRNKVATICRLRPASIRVLAGLCSSFGIETAQVYVDHQLRDRQHKRAIAVSGTRAREHSSSKAMVKLDSQTVDSCGWKIYANFRHGLKF